MKFDLRDLELFVAVADAGSIARAAERSHTVASAVSKRISDLEEVFGCALIVRAAKGVELTAAGHALLVRARVLLHQAAQLDDEMRRHASGSRGYVRVFANISSIVEFLPGALASFSAAHPDIHVQLEEHVSSAIAAAVADGSADFGILSELPLVGGLTTVPFRNDELVVVLQPGHPLARRQSLAFAEIADQPFVGLHASSALHHVLTRAATETGCKLNWRINVTSFDAACAMVAAGLGVGIVPRAATSPYIRSLSLASIALSDAWARRQLFLCTRANAPLPSAARLLFEHLLGQKQTNVISEKDPADVRRRSVRSFVLRAGRATAGQERALAQLWPKYGIEYSPAPLDLRALFGRAAPRMLEIGFGAGEALLEFATAHPEMDCIGVEVHRPGVGRLLLGAEAATLRNLRVICHDAVEVLQQQLAPASIDLAHIFFPDPWPKKRHHKRRLIQPPFVELLAKTIAPGGTLRLATDWESYAQQMREVIDASPAFANVASDAGFVARSAQRTLTRFERRGQRLGHGVWDLEYRRKN